MGSTRWRSRRSAPRHLSPALLAALAWVALVAWPAGAQTTTSDSTTSTTQGCASMPGFNLFQVTPTTVAPGGVIEVTGSYLTNGALSTDPATPCTWEWYTGPLPIDLIAGGVTIELGTVTVTDGVFSADLTLPSTVTARGAAQVTFTVGPTLDAIGPLSASADLTIVDPAPTTAAPAAPVGARPSFTG